MHRSALVHDSQQVSVVMAAGSVDVAVRQLFFGRHTYFGDLDVEVEILSRQRVIAVDGDHVAGDVRDSHGARSASGLHLELHAHAHVGDATEGTTRHTL